MNYSVAELKTYEDGIVRFVTFEISDGTDTILWTTRLDAPTGEPIPFQDLTEETILSWVEFPDYIADLLTAARDTRTTNIQMLPWEVV